MPVGIGATSANAPPAAQLSMPEQGMVDWRAPVGSHMWLARPHMTLPLSPQPLPTSLFRFGSAPVALNLVSSLLVPTLPAAKNTFAAVTVLVATVSPLVLICSMVTVKPPPALGMTLVTLCSGVMLTLPVTLALAR